MRVTKPTPCHPLTMKIISSEYLNEFSKYFPQKCPQTMEKLSYSCRHYSEPLLNQRVLTVPGLCNSQHDTNTVIKLFPYNHPQFPPSNTREGVMVWTQRGASCKCPCLVLAVLMLKLRTSCQHYRGIGNSPWSPAPRPPQYYGRLSSILSFPGVTLSGRR